MFRKHVIVLWMIIYVTNFKKSNLLQEREIRKSGNSISLFLSTKKDYLTAAAGLNTQTSFGAVLPLHTAFLGSDYWLYWFVRSKNKQQLTNFWEQFLVFDAKVSHSILWLDCSSYTLIFLEYSIFSTVDSTIMAWHHWLGYLTLYFNSKLHWNATRHI